MGNNSLVLLLFILCSFCKMSAQAFLCADDDGNSCNILWEDRVLGTHIGFYNSFIPYDVDNDGIEELFGSSNFGRTGSWFILKYNSFTQSYQKVYHGSIFDQQISRMKLFDIDGDNSMELIIGLQNKISIIDLPSFAEITLIQLSFSTFDEIEEIRWGDIDSDGTEELVVSNDEVLSILSPVDFTEKYSIAGDIGYFDIGNVDNDPDIEILTSHGNIWQLDATGTYIEENDLITENIFRGSSVELEDVDSDGREEAILVQSGNIIIYDVEQSSIQLEIAINRQIQTYSIYDLNNDGSLEIIYAEDQWGSIYANSLTDGSQLWELDNPEHGVTGIGIGDFDGDNKDEICWGAGHTSSGSDFLYISDLNSRDLEWRSQDAKGPYYAIEIADIDKDGQDEIIAVSYDGESHGAGVLSIYDYTTKNLEYQSDADVFSSSWEGIFNLEIYDHNADGDLDIVVAADDVRDGKIWIVDGSTYSLEEEFEFPNGVDEFRGLAITDIDNDNTTEFLCHTDKAFYVINSEDYSIEYEVDLRGTPTIIDYGNVDADPEDEIIVCNGDIHKFNLPDYTKVSTNVGQSPYGTFKLFDWDNDGALDIIAGNRNGAVHVLNGNDLSIMESFELSSQEINGIEVDHPDSEEMSFMIITSGSRIMMVGRGGVLLSSETIADKLGDYDAIEIYYQGEDTDPTIILGSQYGIVEYSTICGNCFQAYAQTFPSCVGASNGSIQLQVFGNDTIPILYSWERTEDGLMGNGTTKDKLFSIDQLGAGTYNINLSTDAPEEISLQGVVVNDISGSVFEIIKLVSSNSTNGLPSGSINLEFKGGSPAYSVSWSGPKSGTLSNITDTDVNIASLLPGEYTLRISDSEGLSRTVMTTLLDETKPIFPCSEPLDIVILNDVSGSVDAKEYAESKDFFVDFLRSVNIGTGSDDSRAAIIEWSNDNSQSVKIQMTGVMQELADYKNHTRSFSGGTYPHPAMNVADKYLIDHGRPGVAKVIVLSTDGSPSASLISLADIFKAKGYHIVTIAFDGAFSDQKIREVLRKTASIDLLAPGAAAYSLLDDDLADRIVNLYLCPLEPGSSSTVYFNRDGAITIDEVQASCPVGGQAEVTFTVSASRELSIPGGTPVMFYHNNPTLFGATPILDFIIPCAIEVGTSETFTINLPIAHATNLFVLFNDDGNKTPPLNFPITDLTEIAYSNNIDSIGICVDMEPTLQALKYTTTPGPLCDPLLLYTIDVCNISQLDAYGVKVTDVPPEGAIESSLVANTNGCSTDNDGIYDIPAGCCVSLTISYDATGVPPGYYGSQDVILEGPAGQVYINFDGDYSSAEDILLEVVECELGDVSFEKNVSTDKICEDGFVEYSFIINNTTEYILQGVSFVDDIPAPMEWVFRPYAMENISIGEVDLKGQRAAFIIDEIPAMSVATFSMDAYVGDWTSDGQVNNKAQLADVIDPATRSFRTLTSNSVSTDIIANVDLSDIDTLYFSGDETSIDIKVPAVTGATSIMWVTGGDGSFEDEQSINTIYHLGPEDKLDTIVSLFFSAQAECEEIGKPLFVKRRCSLEFDPVEVLQVCANQTVSTTLSWSGGQGPYSIEEISEEIEMDTSYLLKDLGAGSHTYNLRDATGCVSTIQVDINTVDGLQITATPTPDFCGSGNGSISIQIAAGTQPYTIVGPQTWEDVGDEIVLTDLSAGDYNLVFSDVQGCGASETFTVPLASNLEVQSIIIQPSCGETFGALELTWSGIGAQYNLAGDINETGVTSPVQYGQLSAGAYDITVTDENGCSDELFFEIFSNNHQAPNIDLESEITLSCELDEVLLSPILTNEDNIEFSWYKADSLVGTQRDLAVSETGIYVLEVLDLITTCMNSDTIEVLPVEEIESLIIDKTNNECHGEENGVIDIVDIEGGQPDFTYYLNDTIIDHSTVEGLAAGIYNLRVEDAMNCIYDTLITITEPPEIFSDGNFIEEIVGVGQDLDISIATNIPFENIAQVFWSPNIECENCLTHTFQNIQSDLNYEITVTDLQGCEEVLMLRILIDGDVSIYVPNIINPNSQRNNSFYPQYAGSSLMVKEMSIYDRWGNRTFINKDFPLSEASEGWQGTALNGVAVSGVYTYMIIIEGGEELRYIVGDITLIR